MLFMIYHDKHIIAYKVEEKLITLNTSLFHPMKWSSFF